MLGGLLAAIVPFDGCACPIRLSDGATVGLIVSPTNAVADFEQSGLIAGHCATCRSRDVEPVLDLVNSRWPVASDLLNRQCAPPIPAMILSRLSAGLLQGVGTSGG